MMFPPYVLRAFQGIPATADEHEYYGGWNSVLNTVFPISEDYIVAPQFPGQFATEKDTIDFAVLLTVSKNSATIFFVEVKAPKYLSSRYQRSEADKQMRKRFLQLYDISISELHGVCAFGTNVAFYELRKHDDKLKPAPAAYSTEEHLADVAPQEWWSCDILDPAG
jgi:hypothetical protein